MRNHEACLQHLASRQNQGALKPSQKFSCPFLVQVIVLETHEIRDKTIILRITHGYLREPHPTYTCFCRVGHHGMGTIDWSNAGTPLSGEIALQVADPRGPLT